MSITNNSNLDKIFVIHNGDVYTGFREIKGKRKLVQIIRYKNLETTDHPYAAHQRVDMDAEAKQILLDLIIRDENSK